MSSKKRARTSPAGGIQKKRKVNGNGRAAYMTVPRTRGVYGQGEMKYFDSTLGVTAIANSTDWSSSELDPTTLNTLFCPASGAAINQRIGREVKVHKIKIRGMVRVATQVSDTTVDVAAMCRVLLVQDQQTNATQMQGEQLMSSGASTPVAINAFQNLANFGRFRVLKDKVFRLPQPQIAWNGSNVLQMGYSIPWKMNVNFQKPVSVRFNATNGGTIADIVDNSFHILAHCDSADLVPQLAYYCRVCYKE